MLSASVTILRDLSSSGWISRKTEFNDCSIMYIKLQRKFNTNFMSVKKIERVNGDFSGRLSFSSVLNSTSF